MQALDLPPFEAKLTQSATNQPLIWDGLRRKHVVLTPEEWVRQHVVHYCWRVDFANRTNERLADIPTFAEAVGL